MARVVVGIDGGSGSGPVLRQAADEARRRRAELRVVSVWSYPPLSTEERLATTSTMVGDEVRALTEQQVARAIGCPATSDLLVEVCVRRGAPAPTLMAASEGADLLVVGRRDPSALRRLVLGSVADQCIRHAPTAVMVVPPPEDQGTPTPGRVLVGIDGSPDAARALDWALAEAQRRGGHVTALHCGEEPLTGTLELPIPPPDRAAWEEQARRRLRCWTASAVPPEGVRIHRCARIGDPTRTLVAESAGAEVLVLGSRGLGGFRRLLLGSVAHHAAHLASCPVVVLPHEPDPAE